LPGRLSFITKAVDVQVNQHCTVYWGLSVTALITSSNV